MLYTGVTSDLQRRVDQHRMKLVPDFTSRCNVYKLVYYEVADNPEAAIVRQRQIKDRSRQKKIDIISALNPQCRTSMKPVTVIASEAKQSLSTWACACGGDCFVAWLLAMTTKSLRVVATNAKQSARLAHVSVAEIASSLHFSQ